MSYYFNVLTVHIAAIWRAVSTSYVTKFLGAALLSMFDFMFGLGNQNLLMALFTLIIIDMLTGIMAAYKQHEIVSSRKAFKTGTKSIVYALFIAAANLVNTIAPWANFTVPTVASFLALTELISIMENSAKLGYSMPQRILNLNLKAQVTTPAVDEVTFGNSK